MTIQPEDFRDLNPTVRMLMGPGPSDVHPRVLRAMAHPTVGHLDPEFLDIMDEIRQLQRAVLKTENEMTLAISGTGSAGMETCFANLIEDGDDVVIGVNGVFGGRMCDVAERYGGVVHRVEADWGQPIDPQQIADVLKDVAPKLVAIVHAETSTGVRQPIEEISTITHAAGSLLLVDAVTSLGGIDLETDAWEIDALYSGTQKCLSCPPGISPVTFSERAMDVIRNRKSKCQSWYLDVSMLANYWGEARAYHHTAPINMLYGYRESLRLVLEEGLEVRIARHQVHHELLLEGLRELGIDYFVDEAYRLPQLNAVNIPEKVNGPAIRKTLLEEYNIEIGGGLGALAGKVWRIGLMGESSTPNHVNSLLAALRILMR